MKIFLSTPISKYQLPNGEMEKTMVEKIQYILKVLEDQQVFNAAKIEKWGKNEVSDLSCAVRDFDAMKESDLVIALIDKRISEGVLIEMGWASALNIPVIAIVEKGTSISKLLRGLPYVSKMIIWNVDWNKDKKQIATYVTSKYLTEQCILYRFVNLWKEKLISHMVELCDVNISLKHPYFNRDIKGIETVVEKLNLINADFVGRIDIKEIRAEENGKYFIVKLLEYMQEQEKELDIYQYIILKFAFANEKILHIEFLGMEIYDNQSENNTLTKVNNKVFRTDEEAIFELGKCWEAQRHEDFIMLFAKDGRVNHPVYTNSLLPRVFIKLMNSTVSVTTEISSIKKLECQTPLALYEVIFYEKIEREIISTIKTEIQYNSEHKIVQLKIKEYN